MQDEKYVFYSCFYELFHESLKRSTFPFSESSICSSRHSQCTHSVIIVSSICAYRAFIVRSPYIHLRSLLRSVRAYYLVSNTNVPMFLFLYLLKKTSGRDTNLSVRHSVKAERMYNYNVYLLIQRIKKLLMVTHNEIELWFCST